MVREFSEDRVTDLAAGVTFFAVFALPAGVLAFVAALGSLSSFVGRDLAADAEREVIEFMNMNFTSEASDLTEAVSSLFDQQRPGLLAFSVIVAFWALSRGFAGLVRALDVAYDLEERRSWARIRLTGLALAMMTIIAISAVIAALVVIPFLDSVDVLVSILRGPVAFVAVMTWATTVYHIAPNHHTPWRWDIPGALLTTALWLALALGFGFYLSIAGTGNQVVGAVGALLVALTWIYLMAMALLVGAELNAVLADRAGIAQQPRRFGDEITQRIRTRLTTH